MMRGYDPTGAVMYPSLMKDFVNLEFNLFLLLVRRALQECERLHGGNPFVQICHDAAWVRDEKWQHLSIQFISAYREAILMMELPRRHAASLERAAGSHPIRVQSMGGGRGRDRARMTYSSSGLLSGSVWQMRRLWLAAHQTPPACASIP